MKKNLLGVFAVVLAISFSAFTTIKAKTTRVWANDGTNYVEVTNDSPSTSECGPTTSSFHCLVQSDDAGIPTSFALSNPSNYSITPVSGSTTKIYSGF